MSVTIRDGSDTGEGGHMTDVAKVAESMNKRVFGCVVKDSCVERCVLPPPCRSRLTLFHNNHQLTRLRQT